MRVLPSIARIFAIVAFSAWASICEPAHALRVTRFDAGGQNVLPTGVQDPIQSSCVITITNVSNVEQTVTYNFNSAATSAPPGTRNRSGTVILAPYGTNTASNCNNSTNDSCTIGGIFGTGGTEDFPQIGANTAATQSLRCSGTISVENTAPGSPGFVIASGVLTTFREIAGGKAISAGASGGKTSAPSATPIVIGEGRAF